MQVLEYKQVVTQALPGDFNLNLRFVGTEEVNHDNEEE